MSDQVVQYELNLKDGLSSGIEKAEVHANKLERTMHSLGERVGHVAEAFGISFAIFKGIEFVHEGIESMEKVHQAEAQLQNTMENMGTYSEEAMEKAVSAAGDLSKSIKFSRADVIELQSQLGLVGKIGENEMGRLTKVSADLATKMGMGLGEAGNLLAKAINAPEMARRLGMALKIDPGVMAHIQNLAKHGKEAEARMELLAVAESKVGGAAEAAFNADPLARFNKTMASIKNDIGALAIEFLKKLTPALEWVATAFKNVSVWIKEHKQLLVALGIGIGVYAAWIGMMIVVTNASTIATWALTGAQTALNFVMSIGPWGWVAIAIGAVTAAVVYCYEHFAKFRAVLWGVWETIKEFGRIVGDVFMGVGKVIVGVLTLRPSMITEGFHQTLDAISNAGTRLGHAFKKGYDDGMADFDESQKKEGLIPKKGKGKPQAFATDRAAEPKTKAAGQKSVTINVSIKDLIGTQNINTTTLKEGVGKIREMVVAALMSSVNDFQIVADH